MVYPSWKLFFDFLSWRLVGVGPWFLGGAWVGVGRVVAVLAWGRDCGVWRATLLTFLISLRAS